MFSPEFTKFLMTYQDEYNPKEPEKKCIYFKKRGGCYADVKIVVKS